MNLPQGWAEANVSDIACSMFDGPFGSALKTVDYTDTGIRVARLENIGNLRFRDELKSFISEEKFKTLQRHVLRNKDVLFSSFVDEKTRVCLLPPELDGQIINKADCFCVRTDPATCVPEFLAYRLATRSTYEAFSGKIRGVTRPRIGLRDLAAFAVELPPLAEQRRIVAKLDAVTVRLARARAEARRAVQLASDLRASVVTAAFAGDLSSSWRTSKQTAALTDAELAGAYERVAGAVRRKAPSEIDWRPNIELPEEWRWVSVDHVVAAVEYGSSEKTSDKSDGVPVLRMGNIQDGRLDWRNLKYLPKTHQEFPSLLLKPGDLLFNRTNSFELVGKSAVYDGEVSPASCASYLIRVRCSGIRPRLLSWYLNSDFGRSWVSVVASQQVGQANINGSKLKALGVPLPPLEEQLEIERVIETTFARADRLEAEASKAVALIDRLEAAILTKAFRGELVPQDPTDEPASVLLERIRARRAAEPKAKRGRRPKQTA